VLFGSGQGFIGVISQIGGTPEGDYCIGATFAATVRNERVRQLLEAELAALPPCAERDEVCDNGQDENCDGVADEGCARGGGGAGGAGGEAGGAGDEAGAEGGTATAPQSPGSSARARGDVGGAGGSQAVSGGGSRTTADDDAADGCSCRSAPRHHRTGTALSWLVAMGLMMTRRRRARQ
jgi:hypothetical protein